jgi:hypothetical protein
MTLDLAKGTGAAMTDKRMHSSRRGVAEYVQRISGFVPRRPRARRRRRPRSKCCGASSGPLLACPELAKGLGEGVLVQAVASSAVRFRVRFGSTGMPGPMVVEMVTFFRYRPLAADGLARSTSSSAAA